MDSLTVKSNAMMDILQVNLTNETQAVCMDPFNPQIGRYLEKVFLNNSDLIVPRSAFWLDRNMPTLPGLTNLSTDNSSNPNPFFNLPFIPGTKPLAMNTIPENAIHDLGVG